MPRTVSAPPLSLADLALAFAGLRAGFLRVARRLAAGAAGGSGASPFLREFHTASGLNACLPPSMNGAGALPLPSAICFIVRPEAIDFYNQLAEKWNDEIGWAERRLITNSTSEHGLNR